MEDTQLEEILYTGMELPDCSRCNDNGCPACDGTKGSPLNPDGY